MCPQFVDFDADGDTDIVTATFEGTVFVVHRDEEGWREPEHLLDGQGRHIVLSMYYDTAANKYEHADRSPAGRTNPQDHCVSAMVMDWDGDGDLDLLLGAKQGRLYLQRNEGRPGRPDFTGVNELLEAGGEPFCVPGGLTAPRPVDWDGDGLVDLVCGSFDGGVSLYRNTGVAGAPAFAAPVTLIETGEIAHDEPRFPNSGCYADPVDYDGDGDLDLLVGGYAVWQPEGPVLTEAEKDLVVELETQIAELTAAVDEKITALREAQSRGEAGRSEEAAIEAEIERHRELTERLFELKPPKERTAGIWLYRRR